MGSKSTVYSRSVMDGTTGEVIQKEWVTRKVVSNVHFVKVYFEDISTLFKLSHSSFRVLYSLAEYIEYNTNDFHLNRLRRVEISEKCQITLNTFNSSFAKLVQKNLVIKLGGSSYRLNPKIFFNGEEIERMKVLEFKITYDIKTD